MSLPRYPKYKSSGVEWLGEVPGHWKVKRLKHACHVFPSNVDKKSYDDETPVNLCNYTDVYYNETITADLEFMEATASTEQIAKFTLRAGDTIITKDSETADDIAIGAYVPADLSGVICGYHLSMIRPMTDTNGAFVKRLFDSTYVKSCVEVRANGLTRVGLGQYEIDNLELPFPPLDEQQTIAAFLDRETGKIDALIAEQRRLVELLAEKRQAVISHAVTKGLNPNAKMKDSGIEWLGEVPAHWNQTAMKRVFRYTVDNRGRTPPIEDTGIPMLEIKHIEGDGCYPKQVFEKFISQDTHDEFLRCYLQPNDILFGTVGSVGKVSLVPEGFKFCIAQNVVGFRAAMNQSYKYLYHLLGSGIFRGCLAKANKANIQDSIKVSDILQENLCVPPYAEQLAIANFLNPELAKFDALTTEANRAIALLQERRSALISAAVTGKIDVRSHFSKLETA